jgi:hypothetical protein
VGLVSVILLCVPLVGYVAIPLSGVGLALGLWGLGCAVARGSGALSHASASHAGLARRFGDPAWGYPLAGIGACLLALVLALLPMLMR